MNSSEVTSSIRELIVHLHRGNSAKAQVILEDVSGALKGIMQSGDDPASDHMQRAQQTMFAIDEVRISLAESNLGGAMIAARDAGKEWR